MKIITVNLPETYIKAIDKLIGDEKCFPSRSELVRVAVREFLIRELDSAQCFMKTAQVQNTISRNSLPQSQQKPKVDDDSPLFVQIPITSDIDGPTNYKTFRIIRK